MDSESTVVRPGAGTKALAIVSVASFWALPLSPFLSMAALVRTKQSTGWPRRLAVTSAWLCTAYTLILAIWICGLAVYVFSGGVVD